MIFEDEVQRAVSILKQGGLVVAPTNSAWMLLCAIKSKSGYEKIARHTVNAPTILCQDVRMLKYHLPKLHPRVETLLLYHNRPLSIVDRHYRGIPAYLQAVHKKIPFCIVQDSFIEAIISSLGQALIGMALHDDEQEKQSYDLIDQKFLTEADYISIYRQAFIPSESMVYAAYDYDGQLEFL